MRVGEFGGGSSAEQRHVGRGVSDVEEAVAEFLAQGGELAGAGEVGCAVGGESSDEKAEVIGDAVGERLIGTGGEVDVSAGERALAERFEERLIVGEAFDVEGNVAADLGLEASFALEQPEWQLKGAQWMAAEEQQDRVDEGVGFYE